MTTPLLELPTDRRRAGQTAVRSHRSRVLPAGLPARLASLGVPDRLASLGAFLVVLHRYTRQEDVGVGLPWFGRRRSDGDTGPLVEFLGAPRLLRLPVRGDVAVRPFLAAVQAALDAPEPGGESPSPETVAAAPLQALFNWQAGDWSWTTTGHPTDYEIVLSVRPDETGWQCALQYRADLFDPEMMDRLLGHYEVVLAAFAETPERPLGQLPLLTAAERAQITVGWNDTHTPFPEDRCLHELFEQQVDRDPTAPAVVCGTEMLAYGELNQRANRLAHHLRTLGVGADDLVGVLVDRSLDMIVSLLAIAKAGGAYVPIDASYPRERIAFMLEDSHAIVLLTKAALRERLPAHTATIVCLDTDHALFEHDSPENPARLITPHNLLYVIYTSGSTGRPKGVILDHRGRVNNFTDFNRRFAVGPGDRLLAVSSLSFDMCAYDVFGSLAAGATIVLADDEAVRDAALIARLIVDRGVTVWHSVPALLGMFVDTVTMRPELHPRTLRLVLLGGDWIPVALPDRLRALASEARVISLGGATEVSVHSTIYDIVAVDPKWTSIPYGAPMANQLAYVLDNHDQLVPIGVPGQLHLGGVGVARGYHNHPDLTSERFIRDPFTDAPDARLYRTGDLALWRSDGNLELLGRMDHQVKIRGYRVELGAIETTLRQHPAVKDAVVLARGRRDEPKQLVGYLVLDPDQITKAVDVTRGEGNLVTQWRAVYDAAYDSESPPEDPTCNFASWNSSYTGKPIPAGEMREWADTTVARIGALNPTRVLEIGCGLGLLLFRLAPRCSLYCGTDFSRVALDQIRRHLAGRNLDKTVTLVERQANDFSGIEPHSFDCVVLNSIVVDFPSADYLLAVLAGAVKAVAPGGAVFVGDVRSKTLAPVFYASVELARARDAATADQLTHRVSRAMRTEEELVVEPEFFRVLPHHIREIGRVDIQLKRGRHSNEMTKYRYDATLHVGGQPPPPFQGATVDWVEQGLTLDRLKRLLVRDRPELLCIRRVPNARLWEDQNIAAAIRAGGLETVASLRARYGEPQQPVGVQPEAVWQICEDLGFDAGLDYSAPDEQDRFDIVLHAARHDRAAMPPLPGRATAPPDRPLGSYCNTPLGGTVAGAVLPTVRRHLEDTLPSYMVPAHFVVLDKLPLTPNGKVDRRALPEPDVDSTDLEERFAAPRTDVEVVLAGIWGDILGRDRVGTRDDFFRLGGHSLLAAQVAARIYDTLQIDVPLRDFFETPTIAALAERLEKQGREVGMDITEIARLVIQLDALTDEEAMALLADRPDTPLPGSE